MSTRLTIQKAADLAANAVEHAWSRLRSGADGRDIRLHELDGDFFLKAFFAARRDCPSCGEVFFAELKKDADCPACHSPVPEPMDPSEDRLEQ